MALQSIRSSQVAVDSSAHSGGPGGVSGLLSQEKDAESASTAPKFGQVYEQIQAKYGEKPQKPRETKKTLGKDDFLKIMLTQMKNQDPTNPFKAEQMATEIAQFTSVEQLQNVNQNLSKMTNQNHPLEQMAMTQLIGKVVTIDRERFSHQEGQNEEITFHLPKNAGSAHLVILSEIGEEVLSKDLGPQKAGPVSFNWDGKKSNTLPAKGGNFIFRIDAKDDQGQTIQIDPQKQAHVIGVSFEGSEPVFLIGDAQHHEKITLKNIVRIEMDQQAAPQGGRQAIPQVPGPPSEQGESRGLQSAAAAPSLGSNYFQFQRGVGSVNLPSGPPSLPPSRPSSPPQVIEEKGFPNGLTNMNLDEVKQQ